MKFGIGDCKLISITQKFDNPKLIQYCMFIWPEFSNKPKVQYFQHTKKEVISNYKDQHSSSIYIYMIPTPTSN
jgi:hypothetical protein